MDFNPHHDWFPSLNQLSYHMFYSISTIFLWLINFVLKIMLLNSFKSLSNQLYSYLFSVYLLPCHIFTIFFDFKSTYRKIIASRIDKMLDSFKIDYFIFHFQLRFFVFKLLDNLICLSQYYYPDLLFPSNLDY